ncbi:MAG: T9SS type A sorting domain-containing protein [Flavobacteriales bacterium]|nr:T9SS type A sorting domain-containing protein [Flavobacteriales bacterium]
MSAQAPAIVWQKTFGGNTEERATSTQQTTDGGYIVAGYTTSNDGDVTGNHGSSDFWVVKLDPLGNLIWQKTIGGSDRDEANSIQQTTDGGYVVAGRSSSMDGDATGNQGSYDYWVVKLDSLGNLVWEKTLGGSGIDEAYSIQQTTDGGYIVAGNSNSTDGDLTGNQGNFDYWVVKLDPLGNLVWQKTLGGSGNWDKATSIQQCTDGGYIVAGYTTSMDGDVTGNQGGIDYWVVKLDPFGNLVWQKALGGSDSDIALSIQQCTDGGYIVAGYTASMDGDVTGNQGAFDCWVAKLDPLGNLVWQKTLGESGADYGSSIQQTTDGGYIVAGMFSSDGDVSGMFPGDYDYWVIKLDPLGNLVWQKTVGGSGEEQGISIQQSTDGGYIVAGSTKYSYDGDVSGNHGYWDIWVVKLTNDFARMNGQIFADLNSDNVLSAGEPKLASRAIENLNTPFQYFSDTTGNFSVVVLDTGVATIAPAPLAYYTPNPVNRSASFATLNQQVDPLNDFAMQPTGMYNDLCVTITPIGFYRPGFPCQYIIDYTNVGTTVLTPTVLFFPDPWLAFDSASTTATSVAPDSVVWQLPALAPFGSGQITAYLTVDPNAGLVTPLNSWVRIEPLIGDANVSNNIGTWSGVTTSSYDPNDILVDKDQILFQDLNPVAPDLTYIIRFQNTGTDTAFTVRIENDIPENIDLSTFQFESSSHPAQINYLQHVDRMQYTFNNILLPDSNTNETASHGYLRYRIKPKNNLLIGDSVLNDARIYFDFNAPIETNIAVTVIETSTSIGDSEASEMRVSPNPSNGLFTITLPRPQSGVLTMIDATGREVLRTAMNGAQQALDLRDQRSGVYILKLQTEVGAFVRSVVVE